MEGYAKVASLMGMHPEFGILRRFQALNMQNLLYLQAEITHLEAELHSIAKEDIASGKMPGHTHDWWTLSQGHEFGDAKQWQMALEIREKLEKYNDALLKQAAILRLRCPKKHELQFLRRWFERPSMGSFPLYGLDRNSWDKAHERDLVALSDSTAEDPFSRWFADTVMPCFHHLIGRKFKKPISDGIYEYDETMLGSIANIASTVIASMLPLCSVIVLYLVRSNGLRLAIIAVLSACFSLALAVLTNARRIEIFAATSAFAAVNVVYLSQSGTLN